MILRNIIVKLILDKLQLLVIENSEQMIFVDN